MQTLINKDNRKNNPQVLESLFSSNGDYSLQKILRYSQRLVAVNKIIAKVLPPELVAHCQIASLNATDVIITVDSAAWLTRLLYLKNPIIGHLNQNPQFIHLRNVNFKVQPASQQYEQTPPHKPPTRVLSDSVYQLFRETASTIDDPYLKAVLTQLANRDNPK